MTLCLRGPLLIPRLDAAVSFHPDGLLAGGDDGLLRFAGPAASAPEPLRESARPSRGFMLPPLVDIHTHIPQHPIRGHFVDGVPDDPPPAEGRLLAGLLRNVFPAEVRCAREAHAAAVVDAFLADTLSHGVVGGAAYMTTSALATRVALQRLPATWSVGLMLMDQQCPLDIRSQADHLQRDVESLAADFGRRLIVTDRFAVAVSSPLRRRAASLAGRLGLRTQTHLNEQVAEKMLVETELYPGRSYTQVYQSDGLLAHDCIVAHCIQMTPEEWDLLADAGAVVAHCPTSNLLLGSGVMPLDEVKARGLPYALATDVGASPTVSMLAEMRRFLQVHAGRSVAATACEALVRATVAPAAWLEWADGTGTLEPGRPMSFIEVAATCDPHRCTAEEAVTALLPQDPDDPPPAVQRVTLHGITAYSRPS